jgi:hypothetical protein
MTLRSRTRETVFLCITSLLALAGCGRFDKVPHAVIERQIALDDPIRGAKLQNVSTTILDAGDPHGLMFTQPVTDADRANGIEARYVATWKGTARDEKGVAADVTGTGIFTHMSSGEWVTNMGIFDSDGHPALTKDVSGTYHGRYSSSGEYLDCTMTLGLAPDYAGSYECSGRQWRGNVYGTLEPTHFTGAIALFAVFRPDAAPIKLGLLDGLFHIGRNPRYTRALIFATDGNGSWHVANGIEEKGVALGVGFRGTSGFGSESDTSVFFEKVQNGQSSAAPPASDTSSVAVANVVSAPANGTVVYSDTTDQGPSPTSITVTDTSATEILPGRPYPNPPTDTEAREAINALLGEVQEGPHRTIDILGYRQLCARPVGPECYVVIDGKQHKVFTLERKADGRIEASDLGSCGD